MKNLFYGLFLVLILSLFSCKKEAKIGVPPNEIEVKDLNATKSVDKVVFNNKELDLLFDDYLLVKAAMVNSDVKKTAMAARKLNNDFKQDLIFKTPSQVALLIANAKDLKKQREFFVGLTNAVDKALQGQVSEGKFYKQMCPMAFEGMGGEWLSNSKEIRNPYYGDEMLACGAVIKVIE